MRLVDVIGTRLDSGSDDLVAYEGPIGGERTVVDLASTAVAVRRLEAELESHRVGESPLRIGILSNHQVETYLSVLAAVLGRHSFVPLNPKFPNGRLEQILALGGVDLVLHDAGTVEKLASLETNLPTMDVSALITEPIAPDEVAAAAEWRADLSSREVDEDHVAYVMFTSGSTGTPKGVPVTYGSLGHYVRGLADAVGMERGLRYTQFFDLSFDLSIHDIFISNYLWGTLVAPSPVDLLLPSGYVARERIDAWFSVPILGAQLGRSDPKPEFGGIRHILFCGEALPMETVIACKAWLTESGDIWNLYGPTEATIAFTAARVTESERTSGNASIGLPFGENEVALEVGGEVRRDLNEDLEGELLLGGPQVFAGYSTDAPSPFLVEGEARWYRSGDLVRVDHEGVYFRGRLDSQVKFRGYRIELGEIEVAARQAYDLNTVAVVLTGDQDDPRLVMFYLDSEHEDAIDPRSLDDLVPSYMVPGSFVALADMPLNQNGKIDRKALTAWDA